MASKNPYLKRAHEQLEYTHEQVREIQKCASDPIYFIDKYCQIQHPVKGSIRFELRPYQRRMLRAMIDNRLSVHLAPRQIGKSWIAGAYLLWFAAFNFEKTVVIASNKNDNAMEMIHRVRFIYERLPHWLKPGLTPDGWNKHSVAFDNDSRIISQATSENTGRGLSISCLSGEATVTIRSKTTGIVETITFEELKRRLTESDGWIKHSMILTNSEYEILTPGGWSDFDGLRISNNTVMLVSTSVGSFECTNNHQLKMVDGTFREASECVVGDVLWGDVLITHKGPTSSDMIEVFDPINVAVGNEYLSEGAVHHNCLFLDELAFVRDSMADEFWTSISPTLATGGQMIVCSTPNGDTNLFSRIWRGAQILTPGATVGPNGFAPVIVEWNEPPGRDEEFKQAEIAKIGITRWRQEYECLAGDTTVEVQDHNGVIQVYTMQQLHEILSSQGEHV